MGLQSKPCWVCDIETCGHVWVKTQADPPQQCPKCRSKLWNRGVKISPPAPRTKKVKPSPEPLLSVQLTKAELRALDYVTYTAWWENAPGEGFAEDYEAEFGRPPTEADAAMVKDALNVVNNTLIIPGTPLGKFALEGVLSEAEELLHQDLTRPHRKTAIRSLVGKLLVG
jgi:hypothetical protein